MNIQINITNATLSSLYETWTNEVDRLYQIESKSFEMKKYKVSELEEAFNDDKSPEEFVDSKKGDMIIEDFDEEDENLINWNDEE